MKTLVIMILLSLSICSNLIGQPKIDTTQNQNSQHIFTDLNQTGARLVRFSNQAQAGIFLEVLGSTFVTLSASLGTHNPNYDFLTIGGASIMVVGFIMNWTSYHHTRKAGHILESIKPARSGIGVAIPINTGKQSD